MTTTDSTTEQPALDTGAEPTERLALEAGHGEIVPQDLHAVHSPGQYVVVALILGVMTAIEIWLSYTHISHTAQTLLLVGLMVLKFSLVVLYFMHLRYDKPVFRRLFVTGLALAIAVFLIVLLAQHADVNHSSKQPSGGTPTTAASSGNA